MSLVDPIAAVTTCLTEIRDAANTSMLWTWDKRYKTALLAIKPEFAHPISESFSKFFSDSWTPESASSGPEIVQELVGFLAGLQGNQTLYTKVLDGNLISYAAFWPWAGNTNISVRVGVYGSPNSASVQTGDIVSAIKSVYGIET